MKKRAKIEKKVISKKEKYLNLVKTWAKENFSKKNNIVRLISFAIAIVLIIPAGVALNLWSQSIYPSSPSDAFCIYVEFNSGLSWSWLSKSDPSVVFGVQWTVTFVMLIIFLCSRKPYLCLLFSLAMVGGFFNVIDRSIIKVTANGSTFENCVVDYFKMGGFGAIFNVPDVGIVFGVLGGGAFYFINSLIELSKDYKKIEKKNKKK